MFHMLTCFNMKPDFQLVDFQQALSAYTEHMRELDLVEGYDPIGMRQTDTIMDTDDERDHKYFTLMHFRDRIQCDEAVDYIKTHQEPGNSIHKEVYSKVQDPVFICWSDI